MARTNQGGSVLGFVVVAVIMAGLLIGGVYAMRQLTAVPQQNAEPSKTATENKPSTNPKSQETQQNNDTKSEGTQNKSQAQMGDNSQASSAGELPQTGPGESLLGTVLAFAALTGAAASYARSRRPELSL